MKKIIIAMMLTLSFPVMSENYEVCLKKDAQNKIRYLIKYEKEIISVESLDSDSFGYVLITWKYDWSYNKFD